MKVFIFLLLVASSFASNDLIVNGDPAYGGQFPYMAYMVFEMKNTNRYCGGSLISLDWILTAGRCADEAQRISVTLGTIYKNGTGGINIKTTEFKIHENYDKETHENDICLVKIDLTSSDFNSNLVKPIKLPDMSETPSLYENKLSVVSGWGQKAAGNSRPEILQYLYGKVVSNEECKEYYDGEQEIKDSMMCLSKGPRGICYGDLGSPLVLVNSYILLGVAILHDDSCEKGYAGFTRVTSYLDWIKDITCINNEGD